MSLRFVLLAKAISGNRLLRTGRQYDVDSHADLDPIPFGNEEGMAVIQVNGEDTPDDSNTSPKTDVQASDGVPVSNLESTAAKTRAKSSTDTQANVEQEASDYADEQAKAEKGALAAVYYIEPTAHWPFNANSSDSGEGQTSYYSDLSQHGQTSSHRGAAALSEQAQRLAGPPTSSSLIYSDLNHGGTPGGALGGDLSHRYGDGTQHPAHHTSSATPVNHLLAIHASPHPLTQPSAHQPVSVNMVSNTKVTITPQDAQQILVQNAQTLKRQAINQQTIQVANQAAMQAAAPNSLNKQAINLQAIQAANAQVIMAANAEAAARQIGRALENQKVGKEDDFFDGLSHFQTSEKISAQTPESKPEMIDLQGSSQNQPVPSTKSAQKVEKKTDAHTLAAAKGLYAASVENERIKRVSDGLRQVVKTSNEDRTDPKTIVVPSSKTENEATLGAILGKLNTIESEQNKIKNDIVKIAHRSVELEKTEKTTQEFVKKARERSDAEKTEDEKDERKTKLANDNSSHEREDEGLQTMRDHDMSDIDNAYAAESGRTDGKTKEQTQDEQVFTASQTNKDSKSAERTIEVGQSVRDKKRKKITDDLINTLAVADKKLASSGEEPSEVADDAADVASEQAPPTAPVAEQSQAAPAASAEGQSQAAPAAPMAKRSQTVPALVKSQASPAAGQSQAVPAAPTAEQSQTVPAPGQSEAAPAASTVDDSSAAASSVSANPVVAGLTVANTVAASPAAATPVAPSRAPAVASGNPPYDSLTDQQHNDSLTVQDLNLSLNTKPIDTYLTGDHPALIKPDDHILTGTVTAGKSDASKPSNAESNNNNVNSIDNAESFIEKSSTPGTPRVTSNNQAALDKEHEELAKSILAAAQKEKRDKNQRNADFAYDHAYLVASKPLGQDNKMTAAHQGGSSQSSHLETKSESKSRLQTNTEQLDSLWSAEDKQLERLLPSEIQKKPQSNDLDKLFGEVDAEDGKIQGQVKKAMDVAMKKAGERLAGALPLA